MCFYLSAEKGLKRCFCSEAEKKRKNPLNGGSNAQLLLDALAGGVVRSSLDASERQARADTAPALAFSFAEGTDGASPTPAARVTARARGERAAALSNSTRSLPNTPGLAGE